MKVFNKYVPGLLLLLVIATVSTYVAESLPNSISSVIGKVFIAVLLGILIANIFRPSKEVFAAGIKFGSSSLLKLGIIFMGTSVSFSDMINIGLGPVIVILTLMILVLSTTFLLGKLLNVSFRRKLLISIGICICGNSAIVATAPAIEADEEEVAMAVSIITLFGVAAVLFYPLIGRALGMSEILFGAWAGTAINDTSQVAAAGQIYGDVAAKTAVTIKLIRNIMIVPAVLLASFFYHKNAAKHEKPQQNQERQRINIIKLFPMFVLGFLGMAILNSTGLLDHAIFGKAINQWFTEMSKFLTLIALSGIGLGVILKKLKAIGWKPFMLGFVVEGILAVAAVLLNMLFFK